MPRSVPRRDKPRTSLAPMAIVIATVSIAGGQAAAAMTIGHAAAPGVRLRAVADVQPAGPLQPFAATPIVIPLDPTPPAVTTAGKTAKRTRLLPPAATAHPVVLPTSFSATETAIPKPVLAAYVNAAKLADDSHPLCHLQWQTIAGIGFIESDNARSGGSATPGWDGIASPPILGPVLNGSDGFAAIHDTDGGVLDGNARWDRAIGPMQFLPSTWEEYEADGDHDGKANPQDIDDATLAAAGYLCATGNHLNWAKPRIRAIYAYDHSYRYVKAVLTVTAHYESVSPAKLGADKLPNGSPRSRRHHTLAPHRSGSPAPTSTATPAPTPKPPTTPTPTPIPTPSQSPSASPTASPHQTPTSDPIASAPAGRPTRPGR